jgi:hypothetical protein
VDHVAFYQLDPTTGVATLMGRDSEEPYTLNVVMPGTATALQFFAQAVDDAGQATDSAAVGVTVLP